MDLNEVDALLDRVVERRQVGVRRPIRVLVGEQLAVEQTDSDSARGSEFSSYRSINRVEVNQTNKKQVSRSGRNPNVMKKVSRRRMRQANTHGSIGQYIV